jgi:5-methylcytosine-specific restriction enzyme A
MGSLRGQKRIEFSAKVRGAALKRCMRNGVPHCESCRAELNARTGIVFEHVIPAGLGGEATLENRKVHRKTCADIKTLTEDNPRMQKADRVFKRHHGLKETKRPLPGSKKSGWKRKMDGWLVRR